LPNAKVQIEWGQHFKNDFVFRRALSVWRHHLNGGGAVGFIGRKNIYRVCKRNLLPGTCSLPRDNGRSGLRLRIIIVVDKGGVFEKLHICAVNSEFF
jgi:hypothetical protein